MLLAAWGPTTASPESTTTATIFVSSRNDSGAGSLREALLLINNTTSNSSSTPFPSPSSPPAIISVNLTALRLQTPHTPGPITIALLRPLPTIYRPAILNLHGLTLLLLDTNTTAPLLHIRASAVGTQIRDVLLNTTLAPARAPPGILCEAAYAVVDNVTSSNFSPNIAVVGAPHVTLSNLNLHRSPSSNLYADSAANLSVSLTSARSAAGAGIRLTNVSDSALTGCSTSANTLAGILLEAGSARNKLTRVQASGNHGDGFAITQASDDNVLATCTGGATSASPTSGSPPDPVEGVAAPDGNGGSGLFVEDSRNLHVRLSSVFSGNARYGIHLLRAPAASVTLSKVGTSPAGREALPNALGGIRAAGGSNDTYIYVNQIAARGVAVVIEDCSDVEVQQNLINTDQVGIAALPSSPLFASSDALAPTDGIRVAGRSRAVAIYDNTICLCQRGNAIHIEITDSDDTPTQDDDHTPFTLPPTPAPTASPSAMSISSPTTTTTTTTASPPPASSSPSQEPNHVLVSENRIGVAVNGVLELPGNDRHGIAVFGGRFITVRANQICGVKEDAIRIQGTAVSQVRIISNLVGTTANGRQALGRSNVALYVVDAGTDIVVSGNTFCNTVEGVVLGSHSVLVTGNNVGVDASGTLAIENVFQSMLIRGSNHTLVGNVILRSVFLQSPHSVFAGNLLGVDAPTGSLALRGGRGLEIGASAHHSTVRDNVVAARDSGIVCDGPFSTITNNTIGLSRNRQLALPSKGPALLVRAEHVLVADNVVLGAPPDAFFGPGQELEISGADATVVGNLVGLDGSGLVPLGSTLITPGILVSSSARRAHLANNTVANRVTGIEVKGWDHTLTGNRLGMPAAGRASPATAVQTGIDLVGAAGVAVGPANTVALWTSVGISVGGSSTNNTIYNNTLQDGAGISAIEIAASQSTSVVGNTITNTSGFGVRVSQSGTARDTRLFDNTIADSDNGIFVAGSSSRVTVGPGNLISRSRENGIICFADDCAVRANEVINATSDGIVAFGDNARVLDNLVQGCGQNGVNILGLHSLIENNVFGGARRLDGSLGTTAVAVLDVLGSRLGNGGSGMRVASRAANTTARSNQLLGNAGAGLQSFGGGLRASGNLVGGNVAGGIVLESSAESSSVGSLVHGNLLGVMALAPASSGGSARLLPASAVIEAAVHRLASVSALPASPPPSFASDLELYAFANGESGVRVAAPPAPSAEGGEVQAQGAAVGVVLEPAASNATASQLLPALEFLQETGTEAMPNVVLIAGLPDSSGIILVHERAQAVGNLFAVPVAGGLGSAAAFTGPARATDGPPALPGQQLQAAAESLLEDAVLAANQSAASLLVNVPANDVVVVEVHAFASSNCSVAAGWLMGYVMLNNTGSAAGARTLDVLLPEAVGGLRATTTSVRGGGTSSLSPCITEVSLADQRRAAQAGSAGSDAVLVFAVVVVVLVVLVLAVAAAWLAYRRRSGQQQREHLLGELTKLMQVPNIQAQELYLAKFGDSLGSVHALDARLRELELSCLVLGTGSSSSHNNSNNNSGSNSSGGIPKSGSMRAGGVGLGAPGAGGGIVELLGKELGSGEHGKVVLGSWTQGVGSEAAVGSSSSSQLVAVKMLHEGQFSGRACVNLLLEGRAMAMLGQHENVVRLVALRIQQAPVALVLEYCALGDLRRFLVQGRGAEALATNFAWQVARGVAYLHRHMIIHRDVAARNVLVHDQASATCPYTLKLADLGLGRGVGDGGSGKAATAAAGSEGDGTDGLLATSDYYYRQTSDDSVAIKWMCPTAVALRRFTKKSDVWSFGVLMWEIWTQGERPYGSLLATEVLLKTTQGYRLPQPERCPPSAYKLMLDCWAKAEMNRPAMARIVELLAAELGGLAGDGAASAATTHITRPSARLAWSATSNTLHAAGHENAMGDREEESFI